MCIVWATTCAKSNSTRSLVPDGRKNMIKMDFTTLNAVKTVYTGLPLNINPIVLLIEREIIHLINAFEQTTIN